MKDFSNISNNKILFFSLKKQDLMHSLVSRAFGKIAGAKILYLRMLQRKTDNGIQIAVDESRTSLKGTQTE